MFYIEDPQFDYETIASYTLIISVTDNNFPPVVNNLSVTLIDINEPPIIWNMPAEVEISEEINLQTSILIVKYDCVLYYIQENIVHSMV